MTDLSKYAVYRAADPVLTKFAESDEQPGAIEGYGSIFDNLDRQGDRVVRGAFAKSLAENGSPAMLWAHRPDQPVGRWLDVREDDKGHFARGRD